MNRSVHRRRYEVAALLACALVVRLVAAFAVQGWVDQTPGRLCLVAGDAEGYWALAHAVVERGELAIYDPPRRVLRMPAFPLWLAAGLQLVGDRVLWHRVGLAVLGTGAVGLTWLLGRLLVDEEAGRLAGWLAALSPPLAGISVLILSETMFAVGLLTSLVFLAALWKQCDAGSSTATRVLCGLAAGASGGLATLVRPTWLPFVPACALLLTLLAWFRPSPRKGWFLSAAALCLGELLVLSPWAARNWREVGHPVWTTLWAGPSLYDGLHAQATGESDMRFIEDDGIYQRMSEYDADHYYRQAALQFARENPGRAFTLGLIKLGRFWNPFPNAEQFGSLAVRLLLAAWAVPLFGLAACGLWMHRFSLRLWVLAAGPVLFLSAVHAVFIGSVRYRMPAEYALLPLAALGWRAVRGRGIGVSAQEGR